MRSQYKNIKELYAITQPKPNPTPSPNVNSTSLEIKMTTETGNLANPDMWGPAFWLSMHNGAIRFPAKASPVAVERMKGFILGIPFILPCFECSEHAKAFISQYNHQQLNDICSGRESLFKFF